jgi:hypothetical protein
MKQSDSTILSACIWAVVLVFCTIVIVVNFTQSKTHSVSISCSEYVEDEPEKKTSASMIPRVVYAAISSVGRATKFVKEIDCRGTIFVR